MGIKTEKELYKMLEEYGKKCSCPFTADQMLRNQVPEARLRNHEILLPYVQEYRKKNGKRAIKNWSNPSDQF